MRISAKESGMTSDNNKKRAHKLLGVYWLYRVLSGTSLRKATLNTMQIQARSVKNEFQDKHMRRNGAQAAAMKGVSAKRAPESGKESGVKKSAMSGRLLRALLKKEHVI